MQTPRRAQDPFHLDWYLEESAFLADVNNDRPQKNETYKTALTALQRFVMYQFDNDITVVPRGSSHFGFNNGTQLASAVLAGGCRQPGLSALGPALPGRGISHTASRQPAATTTAPLPYPYTHARALSTPSPCPRQIPLRNQTQYLEDWLGLRTLDESGRLVMDRCPGFHMQFTLDWFEDHVVSPLLAVPVSQGPGTWGERGAAALAVA